MEKVKVNFKPMEKKEYPFYGINVEIKPYMSFEDILIANKFCLEQFFKDVSVSQEQYDLFPSIRIAFDTIVVNQCTNIDFDGVIWDDILSSGIMPQIRKLIYNYNEAWDMVQESIRLKNVYVGLNLIANTLPTDEEMNKTIENASGMISQLNKDDPKTLRKIVETSSLINGIDIAKQDYKKEKSENKETLLKEKKAEIANKTVVKAIKSVSEAKKLKANKEYNK